MVIFLLYKGHCCFSANMNWGDAVRLETAQATKGTIPKQQEEKKKDRLAPPSSYPLVNVSSRNWNYAVCGLVSLTSVT